MSRENRFRLSAAARDRYCIPESSMTRFAYLFERFPSFGQTFCYREVAELDRQDIAPPIFSIRNPKDEPPQDWDTRIVERVHYLPEEKELLEEVRRAAKKRKLGADIVAALDEWGRRTDFLRLYQAIYVGLRLRTNGDRSCARSFRRHGCAHCFLDKQVFSDHFQFYRARERHFLSAAVRNRTG